MARVPLGEQFSAKMTLGLIAFGMLGEGRSGELLGVVVDLLMSLSISFCHTDKKAMVDDIPLNFSDTSLLDESKSFND